MEPPNQTSRVAELSWLAQLVGESSADWLRSTGVVSTRITSLDVGRHALMPGTRPGRGCEIFPPPRNATSQNRTTEVALLVIHRDIAG